MRSPVPEFQYHYIRAGMLVSCNDINESAVEQLCSNLAASPQMDRHACIRVPCNPWRGPSSGTVPVIASFLLNVTAAVRVQKKSVLHPACHCETRRQS